MIAQIVKYHPRAWGRGEGGRVLTYFQRGQSNPLESFSPTLAAGAKGVSARRGV